MQQEDTGLLDLMKSGKHLARRLGSVRILLLADNGKANQRIAHALNPCPFGARG